MNINERKVLPFVDEGRDYSEIAFVQVDITDKTKFKPVASIIQNHPFTDLYAFYNSYLDKLIAFNASKHSGTLCINEDTKAILEEITAHEAKIMELKNKIKKETNFNDKVNLNIEFKYANDRLNTLKGKL